MVMHLLWARWQPQSQYWGWPRKQTMDRGERGRLSLEILFKKLFQIMRGRGYMNLPVHHPNENGENARDKCQTIGKLCAKKTLMLSENACLQQNISDKSGVVHQGGDGCTPKLTSTEHYCFPMLGKSPTSVKLDSHLVLIRSHKILGTWAYIVLRM